MERRLYGKPMISREAIRRRVASLGAKIARDYQERDLLMIGVLKGAFTFFADLVRAIPLPLQVDFLVVSRQPAQASGNGGTVHILSDTASELQGRDVLVVEDIVDSGNTLAFLKKTLGARSPKSLCFCTLLDKPSRRESPVSADYACFVVPNRYVVGYGLDYRNKYRNLPYIAALDHITEE